MVLFPALTLFEDATALVWPPRRRIAFIALPAGGTRRAAAPRRRPGGTGKTGAVARAVAALV
ncbi:MAG TPA: hypothetical protein VHE13_08755, partial [Opitutus sp.]|nr:hypothetical protein [Opitutus sp.]